MRTLAAALVLSATACMAYAHQTPTNREVYQFQPYEWWGTLGNSGATYATTATHQGYHVVDARQLTCTEGQPDVNLDIYYRNLSSGYGVWFQATHGSENGCAVESYCATDEGRAARDAQYDTYVTTGGYAGKIYPAQLVDRLNNVTGHHISIVPSAIGSTFASSNTIVYNQACYGNTYASTAWPTARTRLGYPDSVNVGVANAETDTFWRNMDGYGGVDHRSCDWAHMSLTIYLTGNGETVLAPAVVSTTLGPGQMIPVAGMSFTITLDAECNSGEAASNVLSITGSSVTLSSPSWSGNTAVTGTLSGVAGVHGGSTLVMNASYVYSAQNSYAHLDGDGSGGGADNWQIAMGHDDNPAAVMHCPRWNNGTLSWIVESEYKTEGYQIEGRSLPDTTWYPVDDLWPPGPGVRVASVGDGFAEYRLIEVETGGHRNIGNIVGTAEPLEIYAQTDRTLERLRHDLEAKLAGGPASGGSTLLSGEKLIIFCSAAWATEFADFASYLSGWYGIATQVVSIEQFGTPESRYAGIKERIVQLYGQGYRYVLLAGDASDWQYFDGPFTSEYWPSGSWESIRQGYLSGGCPEGGNPELNAIPVLMVKDPLPRGQNVAYYQPYYQLNDMLSYGDVNDDGLPDLAVGRWPITTESEALSLIYKQLFYFDQGGWGYDQPYRVAVYLGDVTHQEAGDGPHAIATATAILSHFRPGTQVTQLLESQYSDAGQRIGAAVNLWNLGNEIGLFVASTSDRYDPGNFFHLSMGFTTDMISYGTFTPVVIGASCGTADEYRTESPTLGRTVCHRMLTADNRGAIAWIGPSAGTVQEGNRVVSERIVQYMQADPSRPVGESVRLALRYILQNTPPADVGHITVAKSYQFLGFPLSPLNHHNYPTMAEETHPSLRLALGAVTPNPVRAKASLAFTLPARGMATIRVFDVAGRLVETIVSDVFESGIHTVQWELGRKMPSGQYYLKLQAGENKVTRSVSVVR